MHHVYKQRAAGLPMLTYMYSDIGKKDNQKGVLYL